MCMWFQDFCFKTVSETIQPGSLLQNKTLRILVYIYVVCFPSTKKAGFKLPCIKQSDRSVSHMGWRLFPRCAQYGQLCLVWFLTYVESLGRHSLEKPSCVNEFIICPLHSSLGINVNLFYLQGPQLPTQKVTISQFLIMIILMTFK